MDPYRTEAYSDFSDRAASAAYELALAGVAGQLGAEAPAVIRGEQITTGDHIVSLDPSAPDTVVGRVAAGTPELASRALDAAWDAFPSWSLLAASERAETVHRIGDIMAERKYELSAWMTYEAGKNWAEAEADTAEAIDFCRYYAHRALAMAEPVETGDHPGEENDSFLIPLGAGVAIPPWNFPLAILVGLTIGPVAAGNTVVLKPASNTPMIGAKFMEIVTEAGVPDGVVNFLPGAGSSIGDALVDDARTRFVNFTGSKEVGLR
ncbi:MAG: aldehyde dehydrogenase family protein, partial [Acidimicrobiia bacterium]